LLGPLEPRDIVTVLYHGWVDSASACLSAPCVAPNAHRAVIEFCCSNTSKRSGERYSDGGQRARVRLTIEHDLTSDEGLAFALAAARTADENTLLWGALPCAGGCSWMYINRIKPGGLLNIEAHLRTFRKVLCNFVIAARIVVSLGGHVAFEWPTGCSL
jgi:hypothetical protein